MGKNARNEEFYEKNIKFFTHLLVHGVNCWKTRGQLFTVTENGVKINIHKYFGTDKNITSITCVDFGLFNTRINKKGVTEYQWDLVNHNLPNKEMVNAIYDLKNQKVAEQNRIRDEKKAKEALAAKEEADRVQKLQEESDLAAKEEVKMEEEIPAVTGEKMKTLLDSSKESEKKLEALKPVKLEKGEITKKMFEQLDRLEHNQQAILVLFHEILNTVKTV